MQQRCRALGAPSSAEPFSVSRWRLLSSCRILATSAIERPRHACCELPPNDSQNRIGGLAMADTAHLWAIGYDDTSRAGAVRDEVTKLAWDSVRRGGT